MFARFKNFICRHRRKLIISSIVVGGTVFAINYVHRKILEWQENEAKEFLKKTKKEQHYRSTERACNQTIFLLSKSLKETVFRNLDSDDILHKIREGNGSRIALWEELKIVVFAQICSLIYAGLMLVLLLRIQLNIIGGYMVRNSKDSPEALSSSSQEKYLSLCKHFLEKSINDLCIIMKKHSGLILKDVGLKQKMTLQDIENIFWRLEASLNEDANNPLKNLSTYLIPDTDPAANGSADSALFKNVVSETVEILQHHDIISIAESSVKRAFSNSVDKVAEYYLPSEVPNQENDRVVVNCAGTEDPSKLNVTSLTLPLAKIVPILHGLYRGPVQNGCPDPWIEQFVLMEQLNVLGANIYEAFTFEDAV